MTWLMDMYWGKTSYWRKVKNIGTQQPDTAPLPYTSSKDGQDWSQDDTWTNFPVWDAPNSLAIDNKTRIDWNVNHNISSNGNKTVLGLLVNSNTLSAENDSKLKFHIIFKTGRKNRFSKITINTNRRKHIRCKQRRIDWKRPTRTIKQIQL
jgi:hypothetical protein